MLFLIPLSSNISMLCIALAIASLVMKGIYTAVDAVDIHSVEKEQQVLSQDQTMTEMNSNQNQEIYVIESELNKTRAYATSILGEIQRFTAANNNNNNLTLKFNMEDAQKIINIQKNIDYVDLDGILSLLERASKKGSDVLRRKTEAFREILKERVDEDQIDEFINKTSNLFAEWLKKIGATEDQIKSRIEFDENHKLLRALIVGTGALHALALNNNTNAGATFGLNHLSVFDDDELIGTYCGTKKINDENTIASFMSTTDTANLKDAVQSYPTSWNLLDQGIVGPVLNQGSCGCCYAFSATQALEGLYAAQNNRSLYYLSQQQIVDCDTLDKGCGGGTFQSAWNYIYQTNGITTSSVYPYTSGNGKEGACQTSKAAQSVLTSSKSNPYVGVWTDAQMQAAAYNQPVSIAIQSSR